MEGEELVMMALKLLVKIAFDDDGPRWHSGATGSEGERAPLLLLLILPWPPP